MTIWFTQRQKGNLYIHVILYSAEKDGMGQRKLQQKYIEMDKIVVAETIPNETQYTQEPPIF